MFILDDILMRGLGLSVPAFDLIWIFERIGEHAYMELYDPVKIRDAIKENSLLYEMGERSKVEYTKTYGELREKLLFADLIREQSKINSGEADFKVL